ncbi:glycosyltransferase family 2 protein [Nocardioides sp. Kera G14]|uniref:glycosyltransferase family 2 protein n=1 Tax=Nocardioides sp. Kera G14 TaxID=2884264 RepID=UPI001D11A892|nr:glycosyltransferase family A protein [Nocardioides sp. Kera G14]UDY23364.1 glycosyltransferase family 2 protein [Nocardioides sp. Kera G14]
MAAVGIVVRTKDRPHFLARALRSITAQTYVDWQAFIVNDGGDPAGVLEVVDALSPEDRAKVTIIDHPTSLGRWPSANAGVTAGETPYLVLHDDDDTWAPTFLETSVAYLDAHPLAPGVVSRIEIVWETPDLVETGREIFQEQLHDPLLGSTLLFNRFVPIGFLYRRELHAEVGLYNEELSVVGDWDFNLKVLSRWALTYLDGPPLAFWHQRPAAVGSDGNSVIGSGNAHEKMDGLVRDAALRQYVGENGLGLVLYLTKFIDQRFVDVENGLRRDILSGESGVVAAHRLKDTALSKLPWRRRS